MPRHSGIWYRKGRGWYTQIDGKQISLGVRERAKRREAMHRLLECLGEKGRGTFDAGPLGKPITLDQLAASFLFWIERHRSHETFGQHQRNLKRLLKWLPKGFFISDFRRHHLTQWLDAQKGTKRYPWGDGAKRGAITTVGAMFEWARTEQYIAANPVARYPKPRAKRRTLTLTDAQRAKAFKGMTGGFREIATFLAEQGCRPQEAFKLEARHVDLDAGTVTYPPTEHKTGAKTEKPRVVYLSDPSIALLRRLIKRYPTGPLFRNSKGNAWTVPSLAYRWQRLREKLKLPAITNYTWRHSYITDALAKGLSTAVVAELAGHTDVSMVSRVYSHMEAKRDEMRAAARLVSRRR